MNHERWMTGDRAAVRGILWVAAVLAAAMVLGLVLVGAADAEVNSPVDHIAYNGDGATKAFAFPFGVGATSQVRVVLRTTATGVESPQTLNSQYAITDDDGDGDYTDGPGGTVTFTTAPASGVTVHISRRPLLTQTTDIDGSTYVQLTDLEDAIDSLVYQTQYLQGQLDRVPMIPETERGTSDMGLPAAGSGYLYLDGNRNIQLTLPTNLAGVDANVTTGWLAVLEGDANGTERINAKGNLGADHWIDVRDYGAAGDGVTDDKEAIQAAIDAAAGGGTVFFPAGTWRITGTIDLTGAKPISIEGVGMTSSVIVLDTALDIPAIDGGSVWTGTESCGWNWIRGIQIRGDTDAVDHGTGIRWQSANPKLLLEQCFIRGMKYGMQTTSDWGCHYRDSYFFYCGVGLSLARQPNGVQIDGIYFQRCETPIVASEAYQLSIRNCIFEHATVTAISLLGGGPIVVDGCYFESPLAGDTSITATRKSGVSISTLTVSNCHFNDDLPYCVRGHAIDELRFVGNTMMTPPADQVCVLSDTQLISNGIKRCRIEGNTTLDFYGSGYNTTLKKYLCRDLGESNPVKWSIGINYDYTQRGTVYYGSMNAVADANIVDMYVENVPQAAWNVHTLEGFAADAESDALTAVPDVADLGQRSLQVTDGAGPWEATRYTRTVNLSALRAKFGDTGNLRVRARCLARNGALCVRPADLVSGPADATQYEPIEVDWTLDVASETAYRLGYEVADGQSGYFGPIELTILGTAADAGYVSRDWVGITAADISDTPTAKPVDYTIEATDKGTHFTNAGASGEVSLTLPTATVGLRYQFSRIAGYAFCVKPATGEKFANCTVDTYWELADNDTSIEVKCLATGVWHIVTSYGTLVLH